MKNVSSPNCHSMAAYMARGQAELPGQPGLLMQLASGYTVGCISPQVLLASCPSRCRIARGCYSLVPHLSHVQSSSLAARFGHLNVVTWLVDVKKCSALDRAQNGVTPVHLAAAKGSINCLKWLSQSHPR